MRMTQFSNFAVRVLMYAALHDEAPSSVPDIARAYGASYDHMKKAAAELCRLGWADQMVLSHDASCFIDWFPKPLVEQTLPDWDYRHVCDVVIPSLRESGVSEQQIRSMTVENPRRIFEQQGTY